MSPAPQFASSPDQFRPKRGRHPGDADGTEVRLFGSHFDIIPVAVRFGNFEARILSTDSSGLAVTIPVMEPGTVKLSVVTPDGSVTSDDDFIVAPPPVISGFDPFGFSRDPSGRNIIIEISGGGFIVEEGDKVGVVCRLEPRSGEGGPAEPSFIDLPVLSVTATMIVVSVPDIPDFDARFVDGNGSLLVTCSDDQVAESDSFPIEGL